MVGELPSPDEAGGAVWRHDWHRYEAYKSVHHRYITNLFDEGIVLLDGLVFEEHRTGRVLTDVHIAGRISCADSLMVEVDKWLEADGSRDPLVRGYSYSYQAWVAETEREVLRYDSAHGLGNLHCHVFDLRTGDETVIPCPLDRLPSLDGFIRIALRRLRQALGS